MKGPLTWGAGTGNAAPIIRSLSFIVNNAGSGKFQLANLYMFEHDVHDCGSCPTCNPPPSDPADIVANAIGLIENAFPKTVLQEDINTATDAWAHIESELPKIAGLTALDVVVEVLQVDFKAAEEGDAANPLGEAGHFGFKVKVTKDGVTDETVALTLNITATIFSVTAVENVIYDLFKDNATLLAVNGAGSSSLNSLAGGLLQRGGLSTGGVTTVVNNTVIMEGRGGSSQGFRLNVQNFINDFTKPNHSYRLEYSGIIDPVNGQGRFRIESGVNAPAGAFGLTASNQVIGLSTNRDANGAFSFSITGTIADFASVLHASTPANTSISIGDNNSLSDTVRNTLTYTGFKIVEICTTGCCEPPPPVENAMFDMQKDSVTHLIGTGGSPSEETHMLRRNMTMEGNLTATPKTLTMTAATRTGSSQGIRLHLTTFNNMTKAGHSYRIEYGGTLSTFASTTANQARFRLESGAAPTATNPVGSGSVADGTFAAATTNVLALSRPISGTATDRDFLISFTATAEEFAALRNADASVISFGDVRTDNTADRDTGITYSHIKIFEICTSGCCEAPDDSGTLEWIVFPADDNVTFIGTAGNSGTGHVMKLDDLGFNPENLPTSGGVLMFDYRFAHNSGRRLLAWTDLSGTPAEVGNISFLTSANIDAEKVIVSDALASNASSAAIELPQHLLYDIATDTYASVIYVALGINAGPNGDGTNRYTAASDQRGGDARSNVGGVDLAKEFDIISTVKLDVKPEVTFATFITLSPGKNASEINFGWFTSIDEHVGNESVLQLIPASELVNDKFWPETNPAGFREFRAPAGSGPLNEAYGFRSNKLIVDALTGGEYAYRVGDGTEEHWTGPYKFSVKNPSNYNLIVISDPQLSQSASMAATWQGSLTRAVSRVDKIGGAAFILSAGDNTGYANDLVEYVNWLTPKELRSLPYFTAVGNHDTVDQRRGNIPGGLLGTYKDGITAYDEDMSLMPMIFNWPNHTWLDNGTTVGSPRSAGPTGNPIRGGGGYYMSYGDTLYISVNSNVDINNAENLAAQKAFMDKAIASHPGATWTILTMHHDLFGNGSGHSNSMPPRQTRWALFLEQYNIDLIITGHDHAYSRSKFIEGVETSVNPLGYVFHNDQMPTVLDVNENVLFSKNPGTFIAPKGTQYLTMGSPADFGKYFTIEPWQRWAAFAGSRTFDNRAQYSIISINGDTLSFESYVVLPTGEELIDSITFRKTATKADLDSITKGMDTVEKNGITDATWAPFQTAITQAKDVIAATGALPNAVHAAYVALYEAYYALDPNTNKTQLTRIIDQVAAELAVATEGRWEGQYPTGSIAALRKIFDEAVRINNLRLSTQPQIDAERLKLMLAFDDFLASVSTEPCPWRELHPIASTGVSLVDLIGWMTPTNDPDDPLFNWGDGNERYNTLYTRKTTVADADGPDSAGAGGGNRTDPMHGPANRFGGRAPNTLNPNYVGSHIVKTYIGNWIRYELNVAQAGMYEVRLGAVNPTATTQRVVIRDAVDEANQQILAMFTVEPSYGAAAADFSDLSALPAPVKADKEIYLPQGRYVIELYFLNDGVNGASNAALNQGLNIDILEFERKGAGTSARIPDEEGRVYLRIPTMHHGDARHRQRGWRVSTGDFTIEEFNSAKYLVLEVGGNNDPRQLSGTSMQIQIGSDANGWFQTEGPGRDAASTWNPLTRTLTVDLLKCLGGETMATSIATGMIGVSYYGLGWSELNLMRAYLITGELEEVGKIETMEFSWGATGGEPLHLETTTANRGDKVSYILGGADHSNTVGSVLQFDEIGLTTSGFISVESATLTFTLTNAVDRRVWVWTDLVGPGNGATATLGVQSGAVATTTTMSIPSHMLFDENTGKFATKIFVAGYTNSSTVEAYGTNNRFRADVTDAINSMKLTVIGRVDDTTKKGGWVEFYNMAEDCLKDLDIGLVPGAVEATSSGETNFLINSGSILSVTNDNPAGGKSLRVVPVSQDQWDNWQGIDFKQDAFKFVPGVEYRIEITGRIATGALTLSTRKNVVENWETIYHPLTGGVEGGVFTYTAVIRFTSAHFENIDPNGAILRLASSVSLTPFNIDKLTVSIWEGDGDSGETPPTPPPPPPPRPPSGGGGGNQPEEDPEPVVQTIPSNGGNVAIPYTIEAGKVTLVMDEEVIAELIESAQDGVVHFDVSNVRGATAVTVPTAALKAMADEGLAVEIDMPQGSIQLDPDAVASLLAQLGGDDFTISLYEAPQSEMSADQVDALEPGDKVFKITIESAGQFIRNFDGTLTITLPWGGPFPATVWYLDEDGNMTAMDTTFDEAAGTVTFTTDHLSFYVIRPEPVEAAPGDGTEEAPPHLPTGPGPAIPDAPGGRGGNTMWWIIAIIAGVSLCAAGVIVIVLRKKKAHA
ncbi:MAG: metallophosphoesterase [Oscillospiraceae bacterium]|nr:metallophosphoesterase [Oscillospiraceae bacterium]